MSVHRYVPKRALGWLGSAYTIHVYYTIYYIYLHITLDIRATAFWGGVGLSLVFFLSGWRGGVLQAALAGGAVGREG